MHVVRGSLSDVEVDRRVTRELTRLTERTGESALRVWTPPRQIAFGRRDSTREGYGRARQLASQHGYVPVERSVGGSAVAYTGETVAFGITLPLEHGERCGIDRRYREAISTLIQALEAVGSDVSPGEPSESFCPGDYSVQGDGKIAGIAQRIRRESALVGGCVIVSRDDEAAVSDVLEPLYAELEIPFDPRSVGSVERAGGSAAVKRVVEAIESAFVDRRERTLLCASEVLSER